MDISSPFAMSSHLEVIPDEEVGRERELEENLDYTDPLRHLMHGADDFSDDDAPHIDATVLPAQRPSILGDTITLTFPDPVAHVGVAPLNVCLKVDASSGCGGMHWPAGQVSRVALCFVSSLTAARRPARGGPHTYISIQPYCNFATEPKLTASLRPSATTSPGAAPLPSPAATSSSWAPGPGS